MNKTYVEFTALGGDGKGLRILIDIEQVTTIREEAMIAEVGGGRIPCTAIGLAGGDWFWVQEDYDKVMGIMKKIWQEM